VAMLAERLSLAPRLLNAWIEAVDDTNLDDKILNEWRHGVRPADLVREFSVSRARVSRVLREAGFAAKAPPASVVAARLELGDEQFQRDVDELKAFLASDVQTDKKLAQRLSRLRAAAREGVLPDERYEYLERRIPGWAIRRQEMQAREFTVALTRTARWVQSAGRLPSPYGTSAERPLAGFLEQERERDRVGRLSSEDRARLDADIPGWQSPPDFLAEAIDRHRIDPSATETSPSRR